MVEIRPRIHRPAAAVNAKRKTGKKGYTHWISEGILERGLILPDAVLHGSGRSGSNRRSRRRRKQSNY